MSPLRKKENQTNASCEPSKLNRVALQALALNGLNILLLKKIVSYLTEKYVVSFVNGVQCQ
jgi:hypothetical protein